MEVDTLSRNAEDKVEKKWYIIAKRQALRRHRSLSTDVALIEMKEEEKGKEPICGGFHRSGF